MFQRQTWGFSTLPRVSSGLWMFFAAFQGHSVGSSEGSTSTMPISRGSGQSGGPQQLEKHKFNFPNHWKCSSPSVWTDV